jgi:hypothetical protein
MILDFSLLSGIKSKLMTGDHRDLTGDHCKIMTGDHCGLAGMFVRTDPG